MNDFAVLRIKIRQPSAHYRVPFTFSRRHTYPIPPFSTVIGMLCNVLGIRDHEDENLKKLKDLYMAIYGKHDSLTREYVWFRNLSQKSHEGRFGSATNRILDGAPEHPGGQMPVRVDVLEDVELLIYLGGKKEFLEQIQDAFKNPSRWIYPLHLGRAEDLVIIEEMGFVNNIKENSPAYTLDYFAWIPRDPVLLWKAPQGDYRKFFSSIYGTFHRVTTFYELKNGVRQFNFVLAKLFEGGGFPLSPTAKAYEFPEDEDLRIPLFLIKIGGEDGHLGKE